MLCISLPASLFRYALVSCGDILISGSSDKTMRVWRRRRKTWEKDSKGRARKKRTHEEEAGKEATAKQEGACKEEERKHSLNRSKAQKQSLRGLKAIPKQFQEIKFYPV